MATFYGQTVGCRGTASRVGSKSSGIKSSVQSYDGSVIMKMFDNDGKTEVDIQICDDSGFYGQSYFCGTISQLKDVLLRGRR